MYSFTNHFGGTGLHQRIAMINGQRSGIMAIWRYVVWGLLLAIMIFACRHKEAEYAQHKLATNTTQQRITELEKCWFMQSSLRVSDQIMESKSPVMDELLRNYPAILYLRDNHLALKLPNSEQVKLFVNGDEKPTQTLSTITFEEINDLAVHQKWDRVPGSEKYPERYRIFISTTHKTQTESLLRHRWKQFLLVNATSDYPLGNSESFSMNDLIEATFFSNKKAFVTRTKKDYLKLYDEYAQDIDLFINGMAVTPEEIEGVHIREVDKLYTHERPFFEWAYGPKRSHRFVLRIQTDPKRSKRDSSYYVFSPFYSGDF
ncbi:hypothetical protein GCM10028807_53780 [Spirosoma daeguense]